MKVELYPDWIELLLLLSKYNLDYLIIGGIATSIYSIPRYTKDLDIFVAKDNVSLNKLRQVLKEFLGSDLNISNEDLSKRVVIQIGNEPLRIDILLNPKGILFTDCNLNRISYIYDEKEYFIIGKEDLIKNKLAVGRPQDLADVASLIK
jgi:hypothetical protein